MLVLLLAFTASIEDLPGDKSQISVNYYNMIKLQHKTSKLTLSSVEFRYQTGSCQQIVRGIGKPTLAETYWTVYPLPHETDIPQGRPVECGSKIRFLHAATGAWLHSHSIPAFSAGGYEVSGFDSSDSGDFWELICDDSWTAETEIKLKHCDTGYFLSANESSIYPDESGGGYEVMTSAHSEGQEWVVSGGIFVDESE